MSYRSIHDIEKRRANAEQSAIERRRNIAGYIRTRTALQKALEHAQAKLNKIETPGSNLSEEEEGLHKDDILEFLEELKEATIAIQELEEQERKEHAREKLVHWALAEGIAEVESKEGPLNLTDHGASN